MYEYSGGVDQSAGGLDAIDSTAQHVLQPGSELLSAVVVVLLGLALSVGQEIGGGAGDLLRGVDYWLVLWE